MELELGNTPPVEWILRNALAHPDVEKPKEPALELPLPVIIQRVKSEGEDFKRRKKDIYK